LISFYRQRLAREEGAIKKDWGGRIAVALAYPNSYRVGMSNLGYQVVYHLLNRRENVVAERFFLPEGQEMSLYLQTGRPLLSLESQSALTRFDLVAFSLSFENDYPNILKILELAKIPLPASDRGAHDPLVMGGGITTFLNPEPLAPFFDFFLLGEAEANLNAFLDAVTGPSLATRGDREGLLRELARNVPSLYVPSLYRPEYDADGTLKTFQPLEAGIPEKITVACHTAADAPVNVSTLSTPDTTFADRILIELGKGCGRSCRFCAAGYVYRPPRVHAESKLLACINEAGAGDKAVGFVSAAVSDTPGIDHITGLIVERGGRFSVSSLRADALTDTFLESFQKAGQRSLAIAPEAGSERLRRVINKHLTKAQIADAVRLIGRQEAFDIRLYFIIGLPTETREDVEAILDLVKSIRHELIKVSQRRGRIGRIKLSVNCFVPKPFTPFQWLPMEDVATLKDKQKWLKRAIGREGGVSINFDLPKWAYVQALLSLGDRRVGSILLLAHQSDGDWERAFRSSSLNPDFFVHRPKAFDETLPWDFIEHGIYKGYLIKEYKLALKAEESDICNVGECERCGACRKLPP